MFLCQVLVLSFILLQVPVVRSYGSTWSFLTSSPTKPQYGIAAADIDVQHPPQSLPPGVSSSVSDSYTSVGPSHREALRLLKALGSRSSCHGEATSSLLVDCAAFKGDALDVNVKISYAVRLAICEFKSTGMSYPDECRKFGSVGLSSNKTSLERQKCLKKLEEKPQYWTTLSNNIQNAAALCAAARHEVDKEELLSLHINITKIQQGLFNMVHTQLNEAWEAIQAKRVWDAEVKVSQQDTLNTLHQLRESAVDALRGPKDKASDIIEELAKQLQSSKESSNALSDELKKSIQTLTEAMAKIVLRIPVAWNQIEESTREMKNDQIRSLQESGRLARELQDALEFSKAFVADNLEISMRNLYASVSETLALLRSIQMTSMSISESFTSLSSSYSNLKSTEYELTGSLQLQQSLHNQMISSMEKASETADHSMAALVKEMERLQDTMQAVERKAHSLWRWELPKKSILTTGILAIFLMVVFIGGKQVTWGMGIFSGLWALAMAVVLIDESHYLNNNFTPATNREEFLLEGIEQPHMTMTKLFQIPLHFWAWVWFALVGGFTFLAFYFSGYYRYWNSRKASFISSEDHRSPSTQQELGARRRINNICIF